MWKKVTGILCSEEAKAIAVTLAKRWGEVRIMFGAQESLQSVPELHRLSFPISVLHLETYCLGSQNKMIVNLLQFHSVCGWHHFSHLSAMKLTVAARLLLR